MKEDGALSEIFCRSRRTTTEQGGRQQSKGTMTEQEGRWQRKGMLTEPGEDSRERE